MKPSAGRIVLYRVGEFDNDVLRNNSVQPGDVLPAVIVRAWPQDVCNLRVFPDGPGVEWKTSVSRGDSPGQWNWPVIEKEANTETAAKAAVETVVTKV